MAIMRDIRFTGCFTLKTMLDYVICDREPDNQERIKMSSEEIEVVVTLQRDLWEALLWRAQTEQEPATALFVCAIEQFLHQAVSCQILAQQLQRECAELAALDFDDIGTEDEWSVIQNEALYETESALG